MCPSHTYDFTYALVPLLTLVSPRCYSVIGCCELKVSSLVLVVEWSCRRIVFWDSVFSAKAVFFIHYLF